MNILHKIILVTALLLMGGTTAWGSLPETPPEGSTAYYDLGIRSCFKKNDYAGAKAMLDVAIKKYPQMSAFHELMGKYYIHQAEVSTNATSFYDKARYHLIRAINIDEKNVQARFHMLKVETVTKHYSSAIVYCNDLLEENPYNEDLWRKKIDLYRKLGNNAEADRLLERLFTIYPNDEQLRKDLVYRKEMQARGQRDKGDTHGQEQTLRQLVEFDPHNPEHHRGLVNLLYRTGRIAEAAEAAGSAAALTMRPEFVEKRASMLCEMNRHREAVEFVKSYVIPTKSKQLMNLVTTLEEDAARAAQYNDAYTSYAKIYESQHSLEALDYLVSTSIERWYLDDAAYYVEESLKRKGESQKMLYNQYLVYKRLGNERKARSLLSKLYARYPSDEGIAEEMMLQLIDDAKELMDQGQYTEAAPILEKVYYSDAYPYLRDAAFQRLYNCYFQSKQYPKAEKMLGQMDGIKRVTQTASLYNAWSKPKRALDYLAGAYRTSEPADADTRNLIAYTYEEISLPYIKNLLAQGQVAEASKQIAEALTILPDNADVLRHGISAAQRRDDKDALAQYVVRGRTLYPDDPYFILKDAQLRHLSGDHRASLDEIAPLLKEYAGDSLLIALYAESSIDIANEHLRSKQPDEALRVVQQALEIAPDNSELYLTQGRAYEQKKEWLLAYESYKRYKPGFAEMAEHQRLLETVSHHVLRNALSLDFQLARPGSEDILSGNAYLDYSHRFGTRHLFNVGLAYAGRDGSSTQGDTEMTRGGTGVQLSAGYEYQFCPRFSGKIEAAAATRYFPVLMGRLTGVVSLPREWQLSFYGCYRLLRSYAGIYGWQSTLVGYADGRPVYGPPEYARIGWHESRKAMGQVGAGVNKSLGRFELGGELSGLMFDKNIYFNSNLKMRFFPREGSSTNLFAVAGVGTAPESSLIDRSMPVGFNKVNTFVGLGGTYFVNRWLSFALSGTWYTMLAQSERLMTTYIANDPYIREDYRNYFYLHGSAIISF